MSLELCCLYPQDAIALHRRIFRDVVIEYAKEGWDVVVTEDQIKEAARRAEYNSEEEARIQIKRAFSFGTSTTIVKVWRVSARLSIAMCKAP